MIKKDDTLQLTIEDIGSDGEGIGHIDLTAGSYDEPQRRYTIFVKDTVIGDVVTVKIMKALQSFAYAKLVSIDKPSPDRVEPKCPIAAQCGGCQIQALDYNKQLEFKQKKVMNDLVRIGGFDESLIREITDPIIGMEDPYCYRNKEQVPVGTDKDGNPVTGFYASHTHSIVPMTSCAIGDPENDLILNTILDYMKAENVPAYDEKTGTGLLRHILIRSGVYSREVMICLVVNGDSLPSENKLVELLRVLPFVTSISINTNKSRGNVILGRKLRVLWGEESIVDTLHVYKVEYEESTRNPAASLHDDSAASGNDTSGIDASRTAHFIPTGEAVNFRISPLSFYQVNPKQTEKLYSIVLEYCKLNGHETAWDLYCGIGTISLFLAKHAKEVYGVESVEDAVRDARNNARLNNIENVEFETGRAEDVLPAYVDRHKSEHRKHPVDVIVVDPPRKGLDDVTIGVMLAMAPPRIVYVSCDPATMSRDLKKLTAAQKDAAGNKYSYKLQRVQPVDQFGHTVHVETVVLLTREV